MNGERFAVMAGAGFDARMIRDADGAMKDRVGRLAYIFTGAKNLRGGARPHEDPRRRCKWFDDDASCVLVGNVGKILGGIEAFEHARPDDGRLELGVVTAEGLLQWTRALEPHRARKRREVAVRAHDEREAHRRPHGRSPRRTSSTAATARRRSA